MADRVQELTELVPAHVATADKAQQHYVRDPRTQAHVAADEQVGEQVGARTSNQATKGPQAEVAGV